MADPLLVALDVDGTLMSYDQEMSDDVRDVVAALRAAGHHVVLASGRSLVAMTPVAEVLGIDRGWVVASNGAVTARLDPDEPEGYVLEDVATFDPGPALRLLREHLPGARYAVEDVGVGVRMNELFPDGELDGVHRVVDFDELWSGEVTRVVVRAPESTTRCTPSSSPSGNSSFMRNPTPTSSTAYRAPGRCSRRSRSAGPGSNVATSSST